MFEYISVIRIALHCALMIMEIDNAMTITRKTRSKLDDILSKTRVLLLALMRYDMIFIGFQKCFETVY